MTKTEILNIANEPSKHIHIVKIDGKDSIVYSSKFVELLELIPTMLTKDDMVAMVEEIEQIAEEEKFFDSKWALGLKHSVKIINKYVIKEQNNGN